MDAFSYRGERMTLVFLASTKLVPILLVSQAYLIPDDEAPA
jgi:hypothetical protein